MSVSILLVRGGVLAGRVESFIFNKGGCSSYSFSFLNISLCVRENVCRYACCVCVRERRRERMRIYVCGFACPCEYMDIRGQPKGVNLLLPPCRFQVSNSLESWQMSLPAKPSFRPCSSHSYWGNLNIWQKGKCHKREPLSTPYLAHILKLNYNQQ